MSLFSDLKIFDFDYLNIAVQNRAKYIELHERFGFEKAAECYIHERKLHSTLMVQGKAQILLSVSENPEDHVSQYIKKHGEGICDVGFLCEDAVHAFETVLNRKASSWENPKSFSKDFGEVTTASIWGPGDVKHTFVSRMGEAFLPGFENPVLKSKISGSGLLRIDHTTVNVEQGKMDEWANFYERVFGLEQTNYFDIRTEHTGLLSRAMQSPNRVIKIPVNEPREKQSQIQEFLDVHHGGGVQHVAFSTGDIINTLRNLSSKKIDFLKVIHPTYYQEISSKVPKLTESVADLKELSILADGDENGYLLQIFTKNLIGPAFYEIIQRKNNDGFGHGNFKSLFQAIEQDQIARGTLKV